MNFAKSTDNADEEDFIPQNIGRTEKKRQVKKPEQEKSEHKFHFLSKIFKYVLGNTIGNVEIV